MFQRRHYVAIAKVLAELNSITPSVAYAFADMLERDNPNFDRNRFLAAARGEPSNGRDR